MKQRTFYYDSKQSGFSSSRKEHGGSLLIGKRRSTRPLSVRSPLHLVLRSDFATSSRSLLRHRPLIENVIKKARNRFRIRVYEKAIVSNHIHLLIKGRRRRDVQNFFRVVSGHIAQEILRKFPMSKEEIKRRRLKSGEIAGGAPGAVGTPGGLRPRPGGEKTREKENKFWETRIYSRVMSWGRDYLNVKKYIIQNTLEALGLVAYKVRAVKAKVKMRVKSGFKRSSIGGGAPGAMNDTS